MKSNKIFIIALISIVLIAGCAAKTSTTTTTAAAASNATTTTIPPTTTTLPELETLATGVSAFYIDTDSLYFMTSEATTGKLMKASKDGKTKTEVAKDFGGASVKNLAADVDYIYFTHELINGVGKFARVSKADGKIDDVYSCNPGTSGRVFSDNDYVFLLPERGTFCRMKKPALSSDGNFRFPVTSGGFNVVQDATSFYFSDSTWIKKIAKVKVELSVLVSDTVQSNIILDSGVVYWVGADGSLKKISTASGSKASTLLSNLKSKSIAVGSQYIYFSDESGINALPIAGGNPVSFTKTSAVAEKLSVDAGYLHWIEAGNLKRKKI